MLLLTACGSQPSWQAISIATLSSDGLTLTVELLFGQPKPDGTYCEQVTDTDVLESSSQVVIGIQVVNTCAAPFPWEQRNTFDVGYIFPVKLNLKKPLGERAVLEKENRWPVRVKQPSGDS
ncbi:hypothetical protein ABT061_05385 [Streptosporangium sp. NPDC002544]|uniref:hypothetical protein n=1 Tax=Streptosporangium sp. NPDC002544 TaxID=3154538 RepID=UPI0033211571